MSNKLFSTSDPNPMSVNHRAESVVEDQGGSAEAYVSKPAAKRSVYLTGGIYIPPDQPEYEPKTYGEEKSVRIKREYPLDEFAALHLAGGKVRGNVAMYVCPWHNDDLKGPNLEVYRPGHKKYGHCKCFRCGGGGSVVDLAMQVFGVSSPGEAMNLIENKTDFDQEKRAKFAERARKYAEIEEKRPKLNPPDHIFEMVTWAHDNVLVDQRAMRYLAARGLGGAIGSFVLGSTSGMPDALLPQAWDGERGRVYGMKSFREAPSEAGSVPRIVIPYLRPDGSVHYCNARAAGKVAGKDKYRKPADVIPEPYMLDWALELSQGDVLMCEGEIDALSLMLTLKNQPVGVFAIPGLNCFTDLDAAKLAGRRIFIVTDNDDAGADGRENLTDMIYGYTQQVYHLKVEPGFNDVNEMLVSRGRNFLRGWFQACLKDAVRPARKRFL